ncbi:hypothetical protein RUND412_008818 [Rhizina undulata]
MVPYTINIENNSGVARNFFIYTEKPDVTKTVDGKGVHTVDDVFQTVFLTIRLDHGHHHTFQFNREIYSVCGKVEGGNVAGPSSSSALYRKGNTHETLVMLVPENGGAPSLFSPYSGSIRIVAEDFKEGEDQYFLGIGAKAYDDSKIITVAAAHAIPRTAFDFVPHNTVYYIGVTEVDIEPGTIFDEKITLVGKEKKVEFGDFNIQVVYEFNKDEKWNP